MAILRQHDPRIGCLAVPVAALGGFIVFALVGAAFGLDAGAATVAAVVGAAVGSIVALVVLRRTGRPSTRSGSDGP